MRNAENTVRELTQNELTSVAGGFCEAVRTAWYFAQLNAAGAVGGDFKSAPMVPPVPQGCPPNHNGV